jgi:site-specific recombinase XerC
MWGLALIVSIDAGSWSEYLSNEGLSAPTIKQRLAAVRMLFDWMILGQALAVNPAAGVVTLSAISLISAIDQQAKSLKSLASAFAVVGNLCSI